MKNIIIISLNISSQIDIWREQSQQSLLSLTQMLETFMMKAEEAICDLMNFIVIQNQNLQTPQRSELILEATKLIRSQIELGESRYRVEDFRFDLF